MSNGQRPPKVRLDRYRIWATLNRLNMSQNEVARKVGTSSSYLSQLMTGKRRPSAAFRKKLMEAMGVTRFDDLFYLEDVE